MKRDDGARNGNGSRLTAWVTPGLLGVAVTVLFGIWNDVRESRAYLDGKIEANQAVVQKALLQLKAHETILAMRGLMKPDSLEK